MAYDRDLAERIRDLLGERPDVTEMAMFGGLAFLVNGHMAVAASGQGGALVRVDPADADGLTARTAAEPMEMHGRPMLGWLRVAPADLARTRQLAAWVERGVSYASSLPPKQGRTRRGRA